MTTTIQTFDSVGTGVRFTFAAVGDDYIIDPTAVVGSTDTSLLAG